MTIPDARLPKDIAKEVSLHIDSIVSGNARLIVTNIPELAVFYRRLIADEKCDCKVILED